WLDAAHNPAGAAAVATAFRDLDRRDPRPLHLVFAMLADKDLAGFLAPFAGLAASATAVPLSGEARARPVEELAGAARQAGLDARTAPDIPAALQAVAGATGPARVLIAGSHVLVGA